VVFSKYLFFRKRNEIANKTRENIFLIFRVRQGFDLAPTYFLLGWKIRVTWFFGRKLVVCCWYFL